MAPICFTETSLTHYQSRLREIGNESGSERLKFEIQVDSFLGI